MCGFGKTSEKEERVKMQKADAKSAAETFRTLSFCWHWGLSVKSDEFFFLQNNQLALLLSSSCSPPISTCRLTQALPVLKDQLSDLQTQPSLRTERWLWWKWLQESLTLAIIRWHCIGWNISCGIEKLYFIFEGGRSQLGKEEEKWVAPVSWTEDKVS